MTENFEALHYVVEGLATAFDPEGEGSWVQVMTAALVVMGATAFLVSLPVGVLVGAAVLAAAVFVRLKDTVVGFIGASAGAGAVMGVAIGGLVAFSASASAMVGQVVLFINIITGQASIFASAATLTTRAIMGGFGLIIGGLAGLAAFAMGKMDGVMAYIMGFASAIMVGLGLFVLGVAAIPAAIIAAVLLVVAIIIRNRDIIWDAISDFIDWFLGALGNVRDMIAGSAVGKAISKYNPFKADGGPVSGGRSYIVGEKGPELFTPSASGSITPNHHMGDTGGGGQTINMSINVSGVTDRTDKRDLAREIGDMINQELRRQGGATTRSRF
jgi:hypothetical protein